jgi:hypothetical protein
MEEKYKKFKEYNWVDSENRDSKVTSVSSQGQSDKRKMNLVERMVTPKNKMSNMCKRKYYLIVFYIK